MICLFVCLLLFFEALCPLFRPVPCHAPASSWLFSFLFGEWLRTRTASYMAGLSVSSAFCSQPFNLLLLFFLAVFCGCYS